MGQEAQRHPPHPQAPFQSRAKRVERIFVILSALVCLLLVGSLRDTRSRFVANARTEIPPVPESVTLRPGKVLVTVENHEGAPLASASVRVLSINEDRAYLAGAARTDARGTA